MKTLTFTKKIIDDSYTRKQIFRVLVASLIVLSICYVYFIGTITFSILARRTLETEMREMAARVSSKEVEYLSLSNKVNVTSGTLLGLVDPKGTIFATRTNTGTVAMR